MSTFIRVIHAQWNHYFNNFSFSSNDFYQKVESIIESHGVSNIKTERVNLFLFGILSTKREYLRVTRKDLAFDICAAPYGNSFFVSWWFGENPNLWDRLVARSRILSFLFGKYRKTYYQMDTEAMYKDFVRCAVSEALDSITKVQGMRLSENDNQYQALPNRFSKIAHA